MKETNQKEEIDNSKPIFMSHSFISKEEPDMNTKYNNTNEFEKEASNIFFMPINCKENYPGNYDNYIKPALNHISSLKKLPMDKALISQKNDLVNYPNEKEKIKEVLNSSKKLILLDLDETLIHAEYPIEENNINKYDNIIRIKNENEYYEIGIYLRNEVRKFLSLLNNYFNVAIFTASEKDYADAIIRYLDPNKNIFKFCLYRYHCINVNDLVFIKDLRVIDNIDVKKTVLIDNNIYSFTSQLNNGILVNSFYDDRDDNELFNVFSYLYEDILPCDDVRKVNENFFRFEKICQQFNE